MTIEIKTPLLPESVADATVAKWHRREGEAIMRDEPLVDVETDKVVLEVVAPADGSMEKILCPEGTVVKAEQLLGLFVEHAVSLAAVLTPENAAATKSAAASATAQKSMEHTSVDVNHVLSPAVRRTVAAQDLDLSHVKGSGKDARITPQDLPSSNAPAPTVIASQVAGDRIEKRVPMTRLRAKIAERLLAAQQNAAILTTFNEIDMAPVITLRNKYKEEFEKKYGVRLGFMSFFVNAVVTALKKFPAVNASIDGNDIVYHGYFDIGIAVSTERGLVVPVLRDADTLSVADIERKIVAYSTAAREGKLAIEDITGGTFTITNGGVFGSLMATPIINPPQSAILGMHKIMERPVVIDKQIVIRPMMYVALSYDHRIIDGAESVQFLVTVKEMLEEPARLLLNI